MSTSEPMLSDIDVTKLKVPDLKRELKMRGLSTVGNKTELLDRLNACLRDDDDAVEDDFDDELLKVMNDDPNATVSHTGLDSTFQTNEDDESLMSKLDEALDLLPSVMPVSDISAHDSKHDDADLSPPAKKVVLNRSSVFQASLTPADCKPTTTFSSSPSMKGVEDEPKNKLIKLSEVSAKDRLEMRARKFNTPLGTQAKKTVRAERFAQDTPTSKVAATPDTNSSLEVLKQRAQRFGVAVSDKLASLDQQQRLEKRKQRFGVVTTPTATTATAITTSSLSDYDKKQQRLKRFAIQR